MSAVAALAGPRYDVTVFYGQDPYYDAQGMNNKGEVIANYYAGSPHTTVINRAVSITKGKVHDFGISGSATGINDEGDVVGIEYINGIPGPMTCFIFRPGTGPQSGLRLLPAQFGSAIINNQGHIAGVLVGNSFGYIYKNGLVYTFKASAPQDINNMDQITGVYSDPSSWTERSFLYSNGQFIDVGFPAGAVDVDAVKMNDKGQVVGYVIYQNDLHPFLYFNGKFSDLGLPPNAINADAVGINNLGLIVGNSDLGPWVYSSKKFTLLDDMIPAGYFLDDVVAINDMGQILVDGGIFKMGNRSDAMLILSPTRTVKP